MSVSLAEAILMANNEERAFGIQRLLTIETCLDTHMTELMMYTLLLGNKRLTFRKTHPSGQEIISSFVVQRCSPDR